VVSDDPAATTEAIHPGPPSVTIPAAVVREMIEHARREYPNEACGLVIGDRAAADGGHALRFAPTRNAAASPYRYEIDSADLLRLTVATDDRDELFWAIVHSHVRSAARPSPTDVGLAFYPDALYVLVSLAEIGPDGPSPSDVELLESLAPTVRAWRILDGQVWEVGLVVVG
jgi:[CysO sulfur-carrier protein]-S-L-cysteine hydrolase